MDGLQRGKDGRVLKLGTHGAHGAHRANPARASRWRAKARPQAQSRPLKAAPPGR